MRATSLGHAGILIDSGPSTILCDPWFVPAFFCSWFPFPRNDRLSKDLLARIENPTHLYISHIHGDHLDEQFLSNHVSREATVLLPDFPTLELERRLARLGFKKFIHTRNGQAIAIDNLTTIEIHVETTITDGPAGDSALVVDDGVSRIVNQNDCRPHDARRFTNNRQVDLYWLQFSGAIWYPMVYEMDDQLKRRLAKDKTESQFARAIKYVESVNPRAVVPSAGPPCFLDEELFDLNVVGRDEISIFPDQAEFIKRLQSVGRNQDILAVPGTVIETSPDRITVTHPLGASPDDIFANKEVHLRQYQADWSDWLVDQRKKLVTFDSDLLTQMKAWFEPLMSLAPSLRTKIGANCLIETDELGIYLDFQLGRLEEYIGQDYGFRFRIKRNLLENVVANQSVDWSNSLFLSCRFSAWRSGDYNEYIYNFFKSLSVERMLRTEKEAKDHLSDSPQLSEEIEIGDYVVQRKCPHRNADLSIFGEVSGTELTCNMHGWKFSLLDGHCLNAENRPLRVRRK